MAEKVMEMMDDHDNLSEGSGWSSDAEIVRAIEQDAQVDDAPPAPVDDAPPAPVDVTPPAPVDDAPPAPVDDAPPAPVDDAPPVTTHVRRKKKPKKPRATWRRRTLATKLSKERTAGAEFHDFLSGRLSLRPFDDVSVYNTLVSPTCVIRFTYRRHRFDFPNPIPP
jgi:hypothetical protein